MDVFKGPRVTFRRTRNVGKKETTAVDKETKERYVTQRGEYTEDWDWTLTDPHGELHPFATVIGLKGYLNKGYTVIGYHDFDYIYKRKDNSSDMVQELMLLETFIKPLVDNVDELSSKQSEIDILKKKLAQTVGEAKTKDMGFSKESLANEAKSKRSAA